jgi:hypothetical protein
MTYLLLLMSLSSDLPGLRQRILDITPGIRFLGHPSPCRLQWTLALPLDRDREPTGCYSVPNTRFSLL